MIAYHVRQSFRPGEITPEEANRLGVEFARRFTKENHAFVVCTHIDKSHIHNHIIWSSVSLEYDRKFRNFWGSTKAVRRLSDTICIENELLSRIKAILRRSLQFSKADTFLEANGVRVDTTERLVWKNEKPLDLPLVEYKLLCLFMQNPNHLMPREMILDRMWDGNGDFVDDNTLSVYIRRLRNKIEDTPNQPKYLLTERGIGYKWVVE